MEIYEHDYTLGNNQYRQSLMLGIEKIMSKMNPEYSPALIEHYKKELRLALLSTIELEGILERMSKQYNDNLQHYNNKHGNL